MGPAFIKPIEVSSLGILVEVQALIAQMRKGPAKVKVGFVLESMAVELELLQCFEYFWAEPHILFGVELW